MIDFVLSNGRKMRSIYLLMSGLLKRPISLYETYSELRRAIYKTETMVLPD